MLKRHRRGDRVRPQRSKENGDAGKKTGLVFNISPATGIGTVGNEPDGAVFMIFDITDGEFGFGTVFHKTPLAAILWFVVGFVY